MIRSFAFHFWLSIILFAVSLYFPTPASAQRAEIRGHVADREGQPVSGAKVIATQNGRRSQTIADSLGRFEIKLNGTGSCSIEVTSPKFHQLLETHVVPTSGLSLELQLEPKLTREDTVVITADVNQIDISSPDPAERVFARQDLLDANPGRPGAPISVPGYPVETASGGIKAPQYFAPGVAGDHGEPIAQYLAVGSYLVPNNLSANAHGNGYADPNIFIPQILESVQINGAAYNVLQGNHSVNLAAIYGVRNHLDPFITVTGDDRDADVVGGMSPTEHSFVAIEASYGNGFLKRLEHRQQYKLNAQRIFQLNKHQLTVMGILYYGFSYNGGLVPIFALNAGDSAYPNLGDTIDPRQKDQTHTALIAANDIWKLTSSQQLQLSGFFRTYNLSLFSDFGQGLIRQSEFRTVTGQSSEYLNKFSESFSLLTGLDYGREAPRRDNLDHYDNYLPENPTYGPFTKVDSSNVTITSITPYAAGSGEITPYFRYYGGWRRDQIEVANQDLLHAGNSFQKWVGLNSPKATISLTPKQSWHLPVVSGSYGQAFFTEDPRIGTGTQAGSAVATAHSYQLVVSETIQKTDLKVTLGHVTSSQELAKIDPDTGLQENQGPGRLRFLTAAARHSFSQGSLLATFSKADARDITSGQPTPEAPRTIVDLLGDVEKLPWGLKARGEFEFVGRKPLGTGCAPDLGAQCVGTSVREFRAAAVKPFLNNRLNVGLNMLFAGGYSGQTIENFGDSTLQEVVGVRIPSYASLNVTYNFSVGKH